MSEKNQVKDDARKLIDSLPDDVTWDELARHVLERRDFERRRVDEEAVRVVTTAELLEKYGLK
jgi:hypothetical protein